MLPPPQRIGDNTHGSGLSPPGLLPRPEHFDVLNHLPENMEISKSLQEEIFAVQQKLQKAIFEHQMYVEKLKDDPNNSDILGQIKKIQVHIVSLGRCQKQIVQRLRKEVDAFKADNANGSKVSVPFLLGLNNNNHITNNNETKHEATANGFGTKPSKENYEKVVRNGDVHHSHSRDNDCAKLRPNSVETVSGEDDVVEVLLDENSDITQENVQKKEIQIKEVQMKDAQKKEIQQEKVQKEVQMKEEQMKEVQMKEVHMKEVQQEEMQKEVQKEEVQKKEVRKEEIQKEEMQKMEVQKEEVQMKEVQTKEVLMKEVQKEEVQKEEVQKKEMQKEHTEFTHSAEKCYYLNCLGLITKSKFIELQNRRVERKRRSTANPHFVYSMLEQPSKRRRYSYLSGNPPHTRQTTARMNDPSSPLNKTQPTKPTSPPAQTKPLVPVQKSTTRPNILRNAESKVFVNKSKVEDDQTRLSVSSAKSVQSVGSKAVHIPGLPSSLTIERIGSDSIVCICCENPGSLTTCKNCSSNYHVSCHTRPAPPSRTCPKCVSAIKEEENIEKDEEEEEQLEGENRFHYKKDEKFEEKERERYDLLERNSDLRLQVYELEKRSQLLGQSFQLQQRMHQDLLGKQEKTQKSIKRLVDFIKLMQLRTNTSSPLSSASTSCLPQPSSSQSPPTISPPQTSTNQKTTNSLILNTEYKTPHIVTITSSVITHDQASPTSKKTRCPTPTNCLVPSSQKSINHTSSSRKSPSRLEGPISLLAVKPKTKITPQFSTTNCRPVAALPFRALCSNPSSPIPCSTIVTTIRNKPIVQSHSMSPYQNCQILFTPSQTTISWTEQPSMVGSPGPNLHAANSVLISQPDQPQKSYCLLTATPRLISPSSNGQDQLDLRRKLQQRRISVVRSTDQEISSTHCSQAIISPIPSPVVHVSHEAQTTETVRSCDSSSAVKNMNWSYTSNQTASQQQSSSSGALSHDSSST
ncbi:PREDICTED: uncharacterized protein LOC108768916 isoform X7 [Trachymyrmex cornetzi]|uniref:uncharacterized protein LOC108768916 isoform X7 n=1 Tax=Trachymyrmex cornetzi TaxID=471704 RepID=UPI00084F799C|nr:PREDICTED: uncharacterized protein LOC108768916 isoform X7 [Trachymyrmex cornetzi]